MTNYPEMIRNVAVVGHLHHGKTALVDMLVLETHKLTWDADRPIRYTDTHVLSRSREISIKSSPMSLVLQTTAGKSHLIHMVDTPGHVNFVDEAAAAMRLTDGIVLVVDVVEGVSVAFLHFFFFLCIKPRLGHGEYGIPHQTCIERGYSYDFGCQ